MRTDITIAGICDIVAHHPVYEQASCHPTMTVTIQFTVFRRDDEKLRIVRVSSNNKRGGHMISAREYACD